MELSLEVVFLDALVVYHIFMKVDPQNPTTQNPHALKRVGMVIELHPQFVDEYRRLHATEHPGVRDLLSKYHLRNFSIFLHNVAGRWLEFGYYEYHGEDFEGDMAMLAAEPRNQEWLVRWDPMQAPLEGETGWAVMEQVYFNP